MLWAILRLVEMEKAVVEGAGAAGLAALIEGLLPELRGKKWVIFYFPELEALAPWKTTYTELWMQFDTFAFLFGIH